MMYHNMVTYFEVGGHVCAVVELKSGIHHGCPLSGTLFAIALDLAIRYFPEQATFASCRIFVFADDVAVVLTKIAEQLVQLARVFDEWCKASGLCLKPRMCVRIPWWDGGLLELRGVVDAVPIFTGMDISSSARYLGAENQWAAVEPKLLARAADVASTGATLFTKIQSWNIHGMSLVAYKGRFVELSPSVIRVCQRAVQKVCQSHWMAFPPQVIQRPKSDPDP